MGGGDGAEQRESGVWSGRGEGYLGRDAEKRGGSLP